MNHGELQDLLEGYVDETLDRPTRKLVDEHLGTCDECRQILEGVAAVPLGKAGSGAVDDRALRRSVRAATLRTTVDAALMLLGVWLALWLVAALVIQPLVVNRGGRAAAMTEATFDLASMYNPGVTVTQFEIQSSSLGRTATASLVLPVGGGSQPLGEISSRVGPIAFGGAEGGPFFPFIQTDMSGGRDARADLPKLGAGTVATVAIWFPDPITIDEAQGTADSTEHDLAVVWAGFGIGDSLTGDLIGMDEGATLGYGTCVTADGYGADFFAASSASSGRSIGFAPPSVAVALERVRHALVNLSEHREIVEAMGNPTAEAQIVRAIELMVDAEPNVNVLVVTGPSNEVAALLDDVPDAGASLLAVDFYNWSTPLCGR